MRPIPTRQDEFPAFVKKAIAKARALAGPLVEVDDLEQAAQLALLEAEHVLPGVAPSQRRSFVRNRVISALREEIRAFRNRSAEPVNLDELIDEESDPVPEIGADPLAPVGSDILSLVWDGETSDEVVTKGEVTDHVRDVVDGMPPETAQVVTLCFGLDGGDVVAPIDVADILDESPEVVLSHLWAAEKLFRHFSSEGRHRRLTPMTDLEFQAFHRVGDLAWYDLRRLHLNNADLRRCDLSHAILSGVNLWGTRFDGARLEGTNLWGAQLDGASFHRAVLRSVNAERAGFCGADLREAVMPFANLWGADLRYAVLDHADLTGSDLRSAELAGADLTRANLSRVDLRGADLRGCKLVGAELAGANLQGVELAGADFRWADLRNSKLGWSNLGAADLRGASLKGAMRAPKLNETSAGRAPKPRRLRPVADSA